MAWNIRKISHNKERAALAVRRALESSAVGDKAGGRGYHSVATAIDAALHAFPNVDWYSVEIETAGDISVDGKGYLTVTVRTIDQDVLV